MEWSTVKYEGTDSMLDKQLELVKKNVQYYNDLKDWHVAEYLPQVN